MNPKDRKPFISQFQVIAEDVVIGEDCRIGSFVNLYGCQIGNSCTVGSFVEIQSDVKIGDRCKIGSHSFICSGVTIDSDVFIGHNVSFINDRRPSSVTSNGLIKGPSDWHLERTSVSRGASIGTGATILCGITIAEFSIIGAGAVVTKDTEPGQTYIGNPAQILKSRT